MRVLLCVLIALVVTCASVPVDNEERASRDADHDEDEITSRLTDYDDAWVKRSGGGYRGFKRGGKRGGGRKVSIDSIGQLVQGLIRFGIGRKLNHGGNRRTQYVHNNYIHVH